MPATGLAQQGGTPGTPHRDVADPRIAAWVNEVSQPGLRRMVEGIGAFPARWGHDENFHAVETMVMTAFSNKAAPGTTITSQADTLPAGKTRHNIFGGNPRSGPPVILAGAHFDSTSEQP